MHEPERYKACLEVMSGARRGARWGAVRCLLRLASGPYAAAVLLRDLAYRWGLRPVVRVEVPVVSVGNITAGGTGKTPLVVYLARWFRRRGVRVTVLSRGYGPPVLPEDRAAEGGNDETDLLARLLPDVPQLVDPDRVRIARTAVEELDARCLILDDGFQHRRLARDLDLVTIDALVPFGFGHLLPRGLLREPLRSLRRADLLVVTRCDQADDLPGLRGRLRRLAPGIPVVETRHAPLCLVRPDGSEEALEALRRQRVLAVCGIGNPEAFRRTLASCGFTPVDFLVFPDHHRYTPDDRRRIHARAGDLDAGVILTTEKDLAKLAPPHEQPPRTTLALRVELEVTSGREVLEKRLEVIRAAAGD